jgi:hypothetical protein
MLSVPQRKAIRRHLAERERRKRALTYRVWAWIKRVQARLGRLL